MRAEYLLTPDEYLAAEEAATQKHEYLAGVVYAMAGACIGHSRIVGNISRELHNQLDGKLCEAFAASLKIRIRQATTEFFYYPDVMVDCSNAANSELYAEEPRVIFEVSSPGTARIDQVEKLQNYQTIASLDAYALVEQSRVAITLYRRDEDGWKREVFTKLSDVIMLPSIECELALSAIYERTGLED